MSMSRDDAEIMWVDPRAVSSINLVWRASTHIVLLQLKVPHYQQI